MLRHFQRTKLGDPSFVEGMDEYQQNMLKQSTIDTIRGKISDTTTLNVSAYDPSGVESLETYGLPDPRREWNKTDLPYSPGTSHLATADHTGLAISVITTINLYFGSHVLVPETGIIMNNEMNGMKVEARTIETAN
jgi:gamma-glutamyltranspeptidase/glutathione hydrolase